ncbi:MAG: hypothetical protein J6112_01255 [Clostridia bacterium]|nr:hypothetical protein [Clostridia bacterium]
MKRTVVSFANRNGRRAFAMILAVVVALGLVFGYSDRVTAEGGSEELPYGGEFGPSEISGKVKGFSLFPSTNLSVISSEEAAAEGVPAGYRGYVIKMDPAVSPGVTFDFSAAKINVYSIKSITFRMYVEATDGDVKTGDAKYPEIRIPYPKKDNVWAVRYDASNKTNTWFTMTLTPAGDNMTSEGKKNSGTDNALMSFADSEGNLNIFELAVRRHEGEGHFYVDSVIINYKKNTGTGPIITYDGPDTVKLPKGAKITVEVKAYDEDEERECPVKIDWAPGTVLEEDGYPAAGTKQVLVISSADSFGNTTEHRVNVDVLPKDTTPPSITTGTDVVKCVAGTYPQIKGTIEDDAEVLSVKYTWQKGALDSLGRIVEGTFELRIKAQDTSGNNSEKVITVIAGGAEIFEGYTLTEDLPG